jgi:hypothetical protein
MVDSRWLLMAGDLNAKDVDWNSRLITTRVRLLRDYADRKSCLIYRVSREECARLRENVPWVKHFTWHMHVQQY